MKATASILDVKAFQNLSHASSAMLDRGLHYAKFTDVTPVLSKGQQVSGAYVVVAGQLRVFTLSPGGIEATLYLINPGETCVLALNCIFNDFLYPAWVEASPSTTVAIVPGALYRALFEAESAIRNMTIQAFSSVVFRLMTELEQIHVCNLDQRVASILLLHASSDGCVRMTQQEIASHLGTSRESIARILRQLVGARLIVTSRNKIVIVGVGMLVEFAKGQRSRVKNNCELG